MRYPILTAAILFVLTGCTNQPQHSARFTPEEAKDMLKQCSRRSAPTADALWRVPPSTARKLERDLSQLREIPAWTTARAPGEFYRQYIGITSHGRKLVYINAVSPEVLEHLRSMHQDIDDTGPNSETNWRHRYVGACDGGDFFWGAVYDPETRHFSEFEFNAAI